MQISSESFGTYGKSIAAILIGAVLALGGSTGAEAMREPGHNHMGKAVTMECNGCGFALSQFVKAQIAPVESGN